MTYTCRVSEQTAGSCSVMTEKSIQKKENEDVKSAARNDTWKTLNSLTMNFSTCGNNGQLANKRAIKKIKLHLQTALTENI